MELTAAEYEYYQASRDAFEVIADTNTDPTWLVLHHANHYSHAAFLAMKEVEYDVRNVGNSH